MWEPQIETEKIGPMQYRIGTPDACLTETIKIQIQYVDAYEQPVVHSAEGQASTEYTFEQAGQYRIRITASKERESIPEIPDVGTNTKILKVEQEDIPPEEEAPQEEGPAPGETPVEEPATEETEVKVDIPEEEVIGLGIRLVNWLIGLEPTEARAFGVGLVVGAPVGAALAVFFDLAGML